MYPRYNYGVMPEKYKHLISRGVSKAAATSKMERIVIVVNGWKRLTIITKRSILDISAALDPPLILSNIKKKQNKRKQDLDI